MSSLALSDHQHSDVIRSAHTGVDNKRCNRVTAARATAKPELQQHKPSASLSGGLSIRRWGGRPAELCDQRHGGPQCHITRGGTQRRRRGGRPSELCDQRHGSPQRHVRLIPYHVLTVSARGPLLHLLQVSEPRPYHALTSSCCLIRCTGIGVHSCLYV